MIREIKFRGKRIDNGEWVFGNLVTYFNKPAIQDYAQTNGEIFLVDPETVGQYTNYYGIEFYDGDIISVDCDCDSEYGCTHPDGRYLVVWNEETAGYALKNLNNRIFDALDNFGEENMHNIGNRWDNPDLLERGYE